MRPLDEGRFGSELHERFIEGAGVFEGDRRDPGEAP
jgi:hypothetical protein